MVIKIILLSITMVKQIQKNIIKPDILLAIVCNEYILLLFIMHTTKVESLIKTIKTINIEYLKIKL